MARRLLWAIALALVLIGLAPLAISALSAALAGITGCVVNDSTPPCPILGLDLGPALYRMGTAGLMILLTAPLILCGLVLVVLLKWGALAPGKGRGA